MSALSAIVHRVARHTRNTGRVFRRQSLFKVAFIIGFVTFLEIGLFAMLLYGLRYLDHLGGLGKVIGDGEAKTMPSWAFIRAPTAGQHGFPISRVEARAIVFDCQRRGLNAHKYAAARMARRILEPRACHFHQLLSGNWRAHLGRAGELEDSAMPCCITRLAQRSGARPICCVGSPPDNSTPITKRVVERALLL